MSSHVLCMFSGMMWLDALQKHDLGHFIGTFSLALENVQPFSNARKSALYDAFFTKNVFFIEMLFAHTNVRQAKRERIHFLMRYCPFPLVAATGQSEQ